MARPPSLHAFIETYGTEEACWNHLRTTRWGKDGFQCPRCNETEHWGLIQTRNLFQCHACGRQTSITAGTILQDTKLPLTTWFLAARLVLTIKKGISSHELARQLGVSQETAWYLIQRLSRVVKRADGRRLFGLVETDETYIGGKRDKTRKGRSLSKAPVLGMVEAKPGSAGNLVLKHVEPADRAQITPQIQAHVDPATGVVRTDGVNLYRGLDNRTGLVHERVVLSGIDREASEVFPWIHIVFSNLKRVIGGVHTKASRGQLQGYLDVFCYRFNHRADLQRGLDRALGGLVSSKPVTWEGLKAGGLGVAY